MKLQKERLAQLSDKLIWEIAFWMDLHKQLLEKGEEVTLKLHHKHKLSVKQPEP